MHTDLFYRPIRRSLGCKNHRHYRQGAHSSYDVIVWTDLRLSNKSPKRIQ